MLNLIGIASRARKTTFGADLTIKGVRTNKVILVFLANDAAYNTTKFVLDKSKTYEVLVINDFSSEELSNAVGKQNIKVLGITDQGFRDAILNRKRKWMIWPENKM